MSTLGNGQRFPLAARGVSRYPDSDVLFQDDFDTGFCGWRDHMGGSSPYPALGLCSHPVYTGNRALMVSVGKKGTTLGLSGTGSAYKNYSRFVNSGLITFEGMFAIGGANLGQMPAQWALVMDVQKWDNSNRAFYSLTCVRAAGADPRTADVWNVSGAAAAKTPIASDVPSAGDNENKMNWNYVRFTVNLDAYGGLGGYHSAQIGHQVYDLAALGVEPDRQTPQTTSGVGGGSFAGGLNFGLLVQNRSGFDNAGPSWLVADQLRGRIGV